MITKPGRTRGLAAAAAPAAALTVSVHPGPAGHHAPACAARATLPCF